MFEELFKNKKTKYQIDLNNETNFSCWVLKEIKKEKNSSPNLSERISYGALGLYLQKINAKKKTTSKYYQMKLSNLSEDVFPLERNPDLSFIYYNSNKENLFGQNIYEKKMSSDDKFEEYKIKIIKTDIPEMILYKYKYDDKIFQEILDDSEDEINYIYKILQAKNKTINKSKDDIINCIESIINIHKKQLFDIPIITQKHSSLYNKLFTEEEVVTILSLYDAAYVQFKLRQKKIIKLINQTLIMTNNQYEFDDEYVNNAENELDLDLALSYIGFLITIFNNNSQNKFCNSLMDLNINLNSKKLLQSILEDECDKITEHFCLSPEEVVYNIKVLKKEIPPPLKKPSNEYQLMDLCLNKVNELCQKNKKYHPIYLLQKAINYHIISLSSHPYIAKLIYETYSKNVTLSTFPTEKGKIILNSSHPSYRCKRIEKCPVEKLIIAMQNNENNFSEIYLDIEKCENEGLINLKYDIDLASKNIEELVSLLNRAINGFWEEKNEVNNKKNIDNMSESEDNESSKTKLEYKKKVLVRKLVVKNMILDKEFTQKFYINHIKKKLHNIAEKSLIEKMSNKFYSLITRQYIKNINGKNDDDNYYYSIFFLNANEFCCISIDKNKKIKYYNIFKSFFNKNKNTSEQNKKLTEINELRREFIKHRPKYIILGVNNIGCFQLINYFKEYYNDILIYSDYLSLLRKPKNYENISSDDESYFYSVAFDQYKFTINPLYFFIENYNFKYEKNFILNIKLDPLQDQINDITLLNYCLETQIKRAANYCKFKFPKEKIVPSNYYCFMNGLGPVTGKVIEDNKFIKNIDDIKKFINKNIYKNIEEFLAEENGMDIENENDYNPNNYIYNLNGEDILNKMINALYPLKVNSIHNVLVNNIDSTNNIVNCILFFNENILNCVLPFNLIPDFVVNKEVYFKKYRIIICKIIEIQIKENKYIIKISNKIQDLEYYNKLSFIEEESYLKKELTRFNIIEEEDYKLSEIEKLKNIINLHKEKTNKTLVKIKEDTHKKNIFLDEIKKEKLSIEDYGHFCIRPSFIGTDHLFLTFSIIEDLTLNYDISIDKNNEYILNEKRYQKIDEIINDFANNLLKRINEFKNNKYFKKPDEMKTIFDNIFTNINNKASDYENNFFKDNIIMCFMEDSPNYGLLLNKTINNNFIIDYIEILQNGFNFHNLFFENISLIIDYFNENHEKEYYKEFICNQHISNIHSLIEDIDIYYDKFINEEEKNEKIDLSQNQQVISKKNQFLGKKLKSQEFSGWDGEKDNLQNNQKKNIADEWDNNFSGWENNNIDIFNKNQKDKNITNSLGNNKPNEKNTWNNYNFNKNNNKKTWKNSNNNNNSELWNNNSNIINSNNLNNNNSNWNENKNYYNFDLWNNNEINNIDNWNANANKNSSNSGGKNSKKEFDNIWNSDNNLSNYHNNNKNDNWADIKNDNKKEKNNNKKEINFNDNDIDIISSEKITNNNFQYKKEKKSWNNSSNNYYNKNNEDEQDKYNNKKDNYKNNNKGIWDKNKKRKNKDNINGVESNFSGWGTEDPKKEEENEEEKEKDYDSKENNISNEEDVWNNNENNGKNEWGDLKLNEKDNDEWGNFGINESKNNNSKVLKKNIINDWDIKTENNKNDKKKNNQKNIINNFGDTTNNKADNNIINWNISANNIGNEWNIINDKNGKKIENDINWTDNNNTINNNKYEISWSTVNKKDNDNWNNKVNDSFDNKKNDDTNKNNAENNNTDFRQKNYSHGNNFNNKNNNKSNSMNNEQIFNCSNNNYYQNSFNNNNLKSNNNYNFNKNRENSSSYPKKKKNAANWKDELFKNDGMNDIKDESEGDIIEFEKMADFGGFNLEEKPSNKK